MSNTSICPIDRHSLGESYPSAKMISVYSLYFLAHLAGAAEYTDIISAANWAQKFKLYIPKKHSTHCLPRKIISYKIMNIFNSNIFHLYYTVI